MHIAWQSVCIWAYFECHCLCVIFRTKLRVVCVLMYLVWVLLSLVTLSLASDTRYSGELYPIYSNQVYGIW